MHYTFRLPFWMEAMYTCTGTFVRPTSCMQYIHTYVYIILVPSTGRTKYIASNSGVRSRLEIIAYLNNIHIGIKYHRESLKLKHLRSHHNAIATRYSLSKIKLKICTTYTYIYTFKIDWAVHTRQTCLW